MPGPQHWLILPVRAGHGTVKIVPEQGGTLSTITIPEGLAPVTLFGAGDSALRAIEDGMPSVDIRVQDRTIHVEGPAGAVQAVSALFEELISLAESGSPLGPDEVAHAVSLLQASQEKQATVSAAVLSARGHAIRPRSETQAKYVQAMDESTVVFGIGPAGTGKTYLAMAKAVQQLLDGVVRRIIVTRPAVEAGESLGFLPGSLTEKVDPYLRPVYDALGDMLEPETLVELRESGTIEVAPLAYMRGRTLNDAFIILDEAQNTTKMQMKMFLTRLGFNSTMVITGDPTQVDLPKGNLSGLVDAVNVLAGIDGIEFCKFSSADVVRHATVRAIIDAYDRRDSAKERLKHEY